MRSASQRSTRPADARSPSLDRSLTPRSRVIVVRQLVQVDGYELVEQWITPDPWSWTY